MAGKNWIAKAVEHGKGVFKEKAEKAGESTSEFAKEKEHAPGKLGKEARLAETLKGMKKKGSVMRSKMYGKKEKE